MQFLTTFFFIKLDEYLEVCPLFALTDLLHLRNTYMHILFFLFKPSSEHYVKPVISLS